MYDFMYASPIPSWALIAIACALIAGAIFCIYKYKDDSHARNLCLFSILACMAVLVMKLFGNCA